MTAYFSILKSHRCAQNFFWKIIIWHLCRNLWKYSPSLLNMIFFIEKGVYQIFRKRKNFHSFHLKLAFFKKMYVPMHPKTLHWKWKNRFYKKNSNCCNSLPTRMVHFMRLWMGIFWNMGYREQNHVKLGIFWLNFQNT